MTDLDDQVMPPSASPIPELTVASVLEPVTLDALDEIRRRQLEIASRLYSGREESAEKILGRGDDDEQDECIHPRFLELRTIVGPDGAPRYDAWLYMVDSGSIFEAGTETVVAEVIQFGLEIDDDEALERALEPLLGSLPALKKKTAKKATAKKKAVAKKKSVTKVAAKKKAVKKVAAKKKSAAKKVAAKKKAVAKKKTVKKVAAKKKLTAKTAAKKKTKKKATKKKAVAKKRSARKKRTAAKK